MLPHSVAFEQLVYDPFARVVSRVDVLADGVVVLAGIPAQAEITADRTQFTRRSATLTLPEKFTDDAGVEHVLAPGGVVGDLLAPFGNELRIYIGFRHEVTGAQELLCQGTLTIWDAEVDQDRNVSVTAYDRAKLLSDRRFPFSRHIGAGTSAMVLLRDLLSVVPGDVVFRGQVTDVALPDQTFDEDRDDAVQKTLEALGCEGFFDVWGTFVVQPIPDPMADPVINLSEDNLVITGKRSLSRDGVKNAIVARGQSTDSTPAPISDLVADTRKSSPTYAYGPFGLVVGFIDNSAITSKPQANNVAQAKFRNLIGAVKSVDLSLVPHYALEPGDPARIDTAGGVDQHLLDQLQMSTDEDKPMSASTRAVPVSSDVK